MPTAAILHTRARRVRKAFAASLLAASLFPAALCARVVDVGAYGFTVHNEVVVKSDAMRAWHALVDEVGQWWPADHTWFGKAGNLSIDARPGGCFCERDGARGAAHMQIGFVDPGRLLRMLGGLGPLQGMGLYGALDWSFETRLDGLHLLLHYQVSGHDPKGYAELAPIVDAVQSQQLGALAAHLGKPAAH